MNLDKCFSLLKAAKEDIRNAQIAESDVYELMVETAGSKTFAHAGEVWTVRSRYNKDMGRKMSYLAKSKISEADFALMGNKIGRAHSITARAVAIQAAAQRQGQILTDEEALRVASMPDSEASVTLD